MFCSVCYIVFSLGSLRDDNIVSSNNRVLYGAGEKTVLEQVMGFDMISSSAEHCRGAMVEPKSSQGEPLCADVETFKVAQVRCPNGGVY